MSGQKRKAEDLEADEEVAEAELSRAIAKSEAASATEKIAGLGSGKAPLYFKVEGTVRPPWEMYPTHPQGDEKPLVLTYFAIRGLGEVPRLILAEAGASFEHIAVTGGEAQADSMEWRKRSPNGLLPTISGLGVPRAEPLSESGTIIRFLAKKYDMAGKDDVEAARIDNLFEAAKTLAGEKALIIDEESIDPAKAKLPDAIAKRIEVMLSDMAPATKDDKVFNYAQIQLLHFLLTCDEVKPGCVKKLSKGLDEFRKTAAARPRIAAYLASPMHFPATKKDMGDDDGGYSYCQGPIARQDFLK